MFRLAEAFAERLHRIVRVELWGYAPEETLSADDLLKVKYQVRSNQDWLARSWVTSSLLRLRRKQTSN